MTVQDPAKIILFGQPGVGKTTLASRFPNPWFIDVEESTRWIPEVRNRQYKPSPKTLDDVMSQVQRFIQEKPGDTLIIDSIDWFEARMIKNVCKRNNMSALGGGNDFGKSYNLLEGDFRDFLDLLTEVKDMGIHVVFTAHMTEKQVGSADQLETWGKFIPKMQKKTFDAMYDWCDAMLFMKFDDKIVKSGGKNKGIGGKTRTIVTMRSASFEAKNRWGLPEEMDFKEDKEMPEPLRTLIWNGFDAYLALKEGRPLQQASPVQTLNTQAAKPIESDPLPFDEVQVDPTPIQNGLSPEDLTRINACSNEELKSRMLLNEVTPAMLEHFVAKNVFNGESVPFEQFPPVFIEQAMIPGWQDVMNWLTEQGELLPF